MTGAVRGPPSPPWAWWQRSLGESAGTGLLVLIGVGSLLAGGPGSGLGLIAAAWFVAVSVPVLLLFTRTGAHLNPAVTAFLVGARRFPLREGAAYIAAQFGGALAAATILIALPGQPERLRDTVPQVATPLLVVFEAALTLLLLLTVLVIAEAGPGRWGERLLLPGAAVFTAVLLIGPLTGAGLNPARTLAPALLTQQLRVPFLYVSGQLLGAAAAVPISALVRRAGRRDR